MTLRRRAHGLPASVDRHQSRSSYSGDRAITGNVSGNGEARSLTKWQARALKPAQRPELVALDRMRARGAVLDPADVEHGAVEVDLVPTEVADLGRPQAVPAGQQDHGGIAMALPVALGRLDQLPDLVGREVLAGPELGILLSLRSNCSFYFGWRDQLEMRFCHVKSMPPHVDCS
jgi:hypothetical protein